MNSSFRASISEAPVRLLRRQSSTKTKCGFANCQPRWLQRFADPKYYLIVSGALAIIQGAYYTYFVGVITTLEKRYAFESKVTGFIIIADTLSPVFTSILLGYFANRVHKPRLIAGSMLLVVGACFLSALPYFIYGPSSHGQDYQSGSASSSQREYCHHDARKEDCEIDDRSSLHPAVYILFLANFINGFGSSAFYTVGGPYLDDNIKKKNSPMYFGAMSALRIFGPTLGFLLSSFCLKFYEDPFYDPGFDAQSPQWIGAWWIGYFILGGAVFLFTVPLAFFPRELPSRFRSEVKEQRKDTKPTTLRDFPRETKRLLKNPLLVCHLMSIIFQVNGYAGYFVFMPKFMESQYHRTASDASLFSGTTGIVSMLFGILLGGFVVQKFRPRPRYLTGYMVVVSLFSVAGLVASIFLGCPPVRMEGTSTTPDGTELQNECNKFCGCSRRVFEPVCADDGTSVYFSPCFAGCSYGYEATERDGSGSISNVTVFEECECMENSGGDYAGTTARSGFCSLGDACSSMFLAYVIVLSASKFVSATGRVGDTLISLRCVDAKDKSFAIGIIDSFLSAFGFMPYALLYGALTDSTCVVWEEACGRQGNCWLYDSDRLRVRLHGASAALIGAGTAFEFVVFLLSGSMGDMYGEEDKEMVKMAPLADKDEL